MDERNLGLMNLEELKLALSEAVEETAEMELEGIINLPPSRNVVEMIENKPAVLAETKLNEATVYVLELDEPTYNQLLTILQKAGGHAFARSLAYKTELKMK
jgi:hypothetical protein